MNKTVEKIYLDDLYKKFSGLKSQADKAIVQVDDNLLVKKISDESNSISILMNHLSGNMKHLWTLPFAETEDKPTRKRDEEFIVKEEDTRDNLLEAWEEAWGIFLETLSKFTAEDLRKRMKHAGREYTLMEGLNRQLAHNGEHIGQIILLAKYFQGEDWESVGFI
jgi:hypothetical protein